MAAVIGALRVLLGIDTSAFSEGLNAASSRMKKVGSQLTSLGGEFSLKVTAPLTVVGATVLRTAGDFEAALNRIGAATGASADEMEKFEAIARDLGKSTTFSAVEAAGAIEMLAKNGVSAADILGGTLEAALNLAAASGSDLAGAADLATDVMLNFGKESGDLGKVVDGVSGVLLSSKFGFDDYRLALAQAGGVAGGIGIELEDFNSVIAATSALFASGSDAGTSFKTFLQRLVPQTGGAAAAMEELGLEFFDAAGNMRPMADVAQELQDGFSGLSDKAKSAALTEIFGTDAMRTAIGLMDAGAEGVRKLDAQIKSASAADQAAARTEGLSGALKQLGSAFDELALSIADAGLLDMATQFVSAAKDIVDSISEADPKLMRFGVIAAATAAAIGPLLLVAGGVATAIAAIASPVAVTVIALGALAGAGATLWANWDSISEKFPAITGVIEGVGTAVWDLAKIFGEHLVGVLGSIEQVLSGDFAGAWDSFSESFSTATTALREFAGDILPEVLGAARTFAAALGPAMGDAVGWVISKITELGDYLRTLPAVFRDIGSDIVAGLLAGLREKWGTVKDWFVGLADAIPDWVRDRLGIHSPSTVFAEIGTNIMDGLSNGISSQTGTVEGEITTFAQNIGGLFADILTGATSFSDGLRNIVAQSVGSLGGSLVNSGISGLGSLIGIPGFASGTNSAPGGLARINELGGEIVDLPRGSRVIPHDISKRMADGAGSGGNSFSFAPVIDARGADTAAVARLEAAQREMFEDMKQTFRDKVVQSAADPRFRGAF